MKPMLRFFGLALALGGAFSTLAACAVDPSSDGSDGEKADVSAESESALVGSIREVGEIPGTGETRTTRHASPPRYAAYVFYANGGEEVDAWVRGQGRADAVAWILDSRGRSLAFNDDAPEGGLGSHITTKLPASLGTKARLRIVFREYKLAPATFSVSVRVKPGMFACTTDADCVKVSRGGCCTGWQYTAVNASRTEDYAAQNLCKPPYPACAPPPRDAVDAAQAQVARCEAKACVLKAPPGCSYGGNQYAVGDNFPSTDGCNTCFCGADGGVGCTKRACQPPPACDATKEPNRKYVANSPEQCMLVRYACEANTTGFSNACGCGCEQAADCPAFINCMPGPGVPSCEPARARCPYTPVAY